VGVDAQWQGVLLDLSPEQGQPDHAGGVDAVGAAGTAFVERAGWAGHANHVERFAVEIPRLEHRLGVAAE
jgi:hypothetical protein